jgi:cytochrome c oxidase subunit 3
MKAFSSTLTGPELETPHEVERPGGGRGGGGSARQYDVYTTLSWVLMIPVVMLFVGLTSSLIVRKGLGNDWISIDLPSMLVVNTFILLASSGTLEAARRALRSGPDERFRAWLLGTAALGALFLVGQLVAWQQLRAQGVYLATNPSSSFFYVLTATHGAHLAGGMTALLYLTARALRNQLTARRQSALRATAVYWHCMDFLWIYLLLILRFWR